MGRFSLGGALWAGSVLFTVLVVVHGLALWVSAQKSAGEAIGSSRSPEQRVRICTGGTCRAALYEEEASAGAMVRVAAGSVSCGKRNAVRQACAEGETSGPQLGVELGVFHAKRHCENCPGAEEDRADGPEVFATGLAADRSLAEALSAVEQLHRERGSALRGTLLDGQDVEREFNVILSQLPAGKFLARRAVPAGCVEGCMSGPAEGQATFFFTTPFAPPSQAQVHAAPQACGRVICSDYAPGTIVALPSPPTPAADALVASLRQSSRLLDERSHALETAGQFEAADEARGLAEQLRLEARGLATQGENVDRIWHATPEIHPLPPVNDESDARTSEFIPSGCLVFADAMLRACEGTKGCPAKGNCTEACSARACSANNGCTTSSCPASACQASVCPECPLQAFTRAVKAACDCTKECTCEKGTCACSKTAGKCTAACTCTGKVASCPSEACQSAARAGEYVARSCCERPNAITVSFEFELPAEWIGTIQDQYRGVSQAIGSAIQRRKMMVTPRIIISGEEDEEKLGISGFGNN